MIGLRPITNRQSAITNPHAPLLSVRDLRVELPHAGSWFPAVNGVSFDLERGESLGVAGESGCGKTLLGRALINLPPKRRGFRAVPLGGERSARAVRSRVAAVPGRRIAMVFQEPGAALDPVRTIGDHIGEAIRLHRDVSARQARVLAVERLREVAFPDPDRGAEEYPHRLSGGQKQRALLAIALAADPELLIADEPTTALDATVAAEVMELLDRLRGSRGLTLLLISHDLGLVARESERALVLYAGRVVEEAATAAIFRIAPASLHASALALPAARGARGGQGPEVRGDPGRRAGSLRARRAGVRLRAPLPAALRAVRRGRADLYPVEGVAARCFLYDGAARGNEGAR